MAQRPGVPGAGSGDLFAGLVERRSDLIVTNSR
jgi:hypothetical protein